MTMSYTDVAASTRPLECLARDVARILGWHYATDDTRCDVVEAITREEPIPGRAHVGARVTFRLDGERVTIRGNYIVNYDDNRMQIAGESHVITVGRKRQADAMATEVRRRLLPAYLAYVESALATIADRRAYKANADRNVARLAATIEGSQTHGENNVIAHGGDRGDGDTGWRCQADVNGDSVNLDISWLTVDEAERVLKLLATMRGGA